MSSPASPRPVPGPIQLGSPAKPLPGSPLIPGDSLRFDPAHAADIIKDLEEAKRELIDIQEAARQLGRIDPGSNDSVSQDFARALEEKAAGGPGSLRAAVEAAATQMQELIDTMTTELREYQRTEHGNAASFRA